MILAAISLVYEQRFPGIVINAVALTFGTLAALLLAYRSGLIRATENFKLGVFAATGAIALLYLVGMGMSFFGARIPYMEWYGAFGLLVTLVWLYLEILRLLAKLQGRGRR